MKLLISPHNDDAVLFAAFTLLRERPSVLTVFDSYVQPRRMTEAGRLDDAVLLSAAVRRSEDIEALYELDGSKDVDFVSLSDDRSYSVEEIAKEMREAIPEAYNISHVWAPAFEDGGHHQHNLVAAAVEIAFPYAMTRRYLTYTDKGKSTNGVLVPITENDWIPRKLRALACYESQMIPELGCRAHFIGRSLEEYYQR